MEKISNIVVKTWKKDGFKFFIKHLSYHYSHHYCGYVIFPKMPMLVDGYNGFLRYAPVHGGITYAQQKDDGYIYGFDCCHVDDEKDPKTKDLEWLTQECERMLTAILSAVPFEQDYMNAKTNKEKADIIEKYHQELKERDIKFKLTDNFGAMMSVLCGNL